MRPIDADALLEYKFPNGFARWDEQEVIYAVYEKDILSAPTIEVEPIIHAHWEKDTTFDGFKVWKCSNCACRFNYLSTEWGLSPVTYAYGIRCGHCGAVMDK